MKNLKRETYLVGSPKIDTHLDFFAEIIKKVPMKKTTVHLEIRKFEHDGDVLHILLVNGDLKASVFKIKTNERPDLYLAEYN